MEQKLVGTIVGSDPHSSHESIRVFIIERHSIDLWGLERLINGQKPHMEVVGTARTSEEACLQLDDARPNFILLDAAPVETEISHIPQLLEHASPHILVLTDMCGEVSYDQAILSGARGVLSKEQPPEQLLTAIEKIHRGELWLDRATTSRVLVELSRRYNSQAADPAQQNIMRLTKREREIVYEVVVDPAAPLRTIARRVHVTERTLRNHLSSIYGKLEVAGRLELLVYATEYELAKPH